jgi:hypothetical protein
MDPITSISQIVNAKIISEGVDLESLIAYVANTIINKIKRIGETTINEYLSKTCNLKVVLNNYFIYQRI